MATDLLLVSTTGLGYQVFQAVYRVLTAQYSGGGDRAPGVDHAHARAPLPVVQAPVPLVSLS